MKPLALALPWQNMNYAPLDYAITEETHGAALAEHDLPRHFDQVIRENPASRGTAPLYYSDYG